MLWSHSTALYIQNQKASTKRFNWVNIYAGLFNPSCKRLNVVKFECSFFTCNSMNQNRKIVWKFISCWAKKDWGNNYYYNRNLVTIPFTSKTNEKYWHRILIMNLFTGHSLTETFNHHLLSLSWREIIASSHSLSIRFRNWKKYNYSTRTRRHYFNGCVHFITIFNKVSLWVALVLIFMSVECKRIWESD